MSTTVHSTRSEAEMIKCGHRIGSTLRPGELIALRGQLGAGKTHFTKGLAAGLGASDEVTSPTFSLVHEYRSGPVPIFHFDFYRLDTAEELLQLGWDDYLDEGGVVLVEWADKFPELFPAATTRWFTLSIAPDGVHLVTGS